MLQPWATNKMEKPALSAPRNAQKKGVVKQFDRFLIEKSLMRWIVRGRRFESSYNIVEICY